MSGNSLGKLFRITTFGESHGKTMGVVIDGCPSLFTLKESDIQEFVNKRKPGQSEITTSRSESDKIEIVSGVFEGKTTGAPICILIPNADNRAADYSALKDIYRPSHADFTYQQKYGIRDFLGGGRSSARETVCRVAAGAVAQLILQSWGIQIVAYTFSVGNLFVKQVSKFSKVQVESSITRCPDSAVAVEIESEIRKAKIKGDSLGGIVACSIYNVPVGLGEPVFDRLEADLAKAMLSINATKGFEIGSGFEGTKLRGSAHNDLFNVKENQISFDTNNAGGVLGGISNGNDIEFKVAFKPTATIRQKQSVLTNQNTLAEMQLEGRHDPCVVPRAVPIVEAMAALVILDHILLNRATQL